MARLTLISKGDGATRRHVMLSSVDYRPVTQPAHGDPTASVSGQTQQAQQGGQNRGFPGNNANRGPNMAQLRNQFFVDEGVLAVLLPSTLDGGTVRNAGSGSRAADAPAGATTAAPRPTPASRPSYCATEGTGASRTSRARPASSRTRRAASES